MPDRAGGLLAEKFLGNPLDLSPCPGVSRPSNTEVCGKDF